MMFSQIAFRNHFYASTGRTRKYPLHAFCGFIKVLDASKITHFKQDFLFDLQKVFENLVDLTDPICQAINSAKADMTIFDSSGIEAFVTKNNPKYANRIIRQLKAFAKSQGFDSNYDPYKTAYGNMPSHATANPEIKQLCINRLSIIRHISFYNKDFMEQHPDIMIETKSDSPDEDKKISFRNTLSSILKPFLATLPLIRFCDTFGKDKHFSKAYIPLNSRSHMENVDYTINEDGIPCCPHNVNFAMNPEGTKRRGTDIRAFKFVCPKVKWVYDKSTHKQHRECLCENPCTSSKCGRMVYIYPEKNLRAYPGVLRGTEEWNETYKIRTIVERNIQHIKMNLCLAGRHTQNEKALHVDLILAGITQLITVLLADKIHKHEYIRSLKLLIA